MAIEPENLTLVLLREIRREQEEARRDGRSMLDMIATLSSTVSRQNSRIERLISDLRDDLEAMVKMEIGGRFAGAESRIERREAAEFAELRRQFDEVLQEIATLKRTEGAE